VTLSLGGFGSNNDMVCSLSYDIAANDLLIGVDDTAAVSKGIIEIDDELIFVTANNSGTLTVPTWGRGYKGTTAADHTAGAKVSVAPTYPKAVVRREVNNTIRAVYPDLFAVKTTDITMDATHWQYELPADCDRVLLVDAKWTTIDGWEPVRAWDVIQSASTGDFASGKFIAFAEPLMAGVTVHITYAALPTLLTADSDLFTATGLPATARDVILYGAAARLLPWMDTGRVGVETVMSDQQDETKPIGNAVSLAREFRTNYRLRLQAERRPSSPATP
jgi:hypothetical protein